MPWRRIRGVEVQLHTFLISVLDRGEWLASCPGLFTPRERAPGTHWIGGWVDPKAGLYAVVRKIPSPYKDLNSPNQQSELIEIKCVWNHNGNSIPKSMLEPGMGFDMCTEKFKQIWQGSNLGPSKQESGVLTWYHQPSVCHTNSRNK
jgi:hypothetical protein